MSLGAFISETLRCAIAPADGDGIAHYLVDLEGRRPVDTRTPDRWVKGALAWRLALDVCERDETVSLSLHGPGEEPLWMLAATKVASVTAYTGTDESGLVLQFGGLGRRVVDIELTPSVSVRIVPFSRRPKPPIHEVRIWQPSNDEDA